MNGSDRFIEAVNSGKSLKLNGSILNGIIIILQWGTVKGFMSTLIKHQGMIGKLGDRLSGARFS